jgi:hypothetical protein
MAYKDILVYLDASGDAADRLRLATELAKTHGARLIGVDASDESALVGAFRALHIRPGVRGGGQGRRPCWPFHRR